MLRCAGGISCKESACRNAATGRNFWRGGGGDTRAVADVGGSVHAELLDVLPHPIAPSACASQRPFICHVTAAVLNSPTWPCTRVGHLRVYLTYVSIYRLHLVVH